MKTKIIAFLYQNIVKKILFSIDPEKVHDHFIKMGKLLGGNALTKKMVSFLIKVNLV